jgi:lysophospholipase L1-like esterase
VISRCLIVGIALVISTASQTFQKVVESADRPVPRTDANSMMAHRELIEKTRKGRIDVYFVGDSITRRWGALDYPELLANWTANFFGWNAANFGWGGDRIQNILWRLENGELDGVTPRIIVVLAGTNNVGSVPGDESKIADITRGLEAIVNTCRRKAPEATIVLTAIFPRNDNVAVMPEINRINENLARLADGRRIRYLNVNGTLADPAGRLVEGMMDARDKLHPTIKGYQVWADGLKPIFTELLGPPAATDHAPPPTGDPAARGRVHPAKSASGTERSASHALARADRPPWPRRRAATTLVRDIEASRHDPIASVR